MAKVRFKNSTHDIIKQRYVTKKTFKISLIIHALQFLGIVALLYILFHK